MQNPIMTPTRDETRIKNKDLNRAIIARDYLATLKKKTALKNLNYIRLRKPFGELIFM